jgi:hypothetical protein
MDRLQDDIPVDGAGRLAGCDSAMWPGWLGVHVRLEVRITQAPTAGTGGSKADWGLQAKMYHKALRDPISTGRTGDREGLAPSESRSFGCGGDLRMTA